MADKKPPKGILKHSSSLDHPQHIGQREKEMKWDEMNILATHHPPDKTYGHMKIDEPPTPYSKGSDLEDDDDEGEPSRRRGSWSGTGAVNATDLASKLEDTKAPKEPHLVVEEDSEEEEEMTDDEKTRRRSFELKRKLHYNEFQAVQLAKKLLAEEEEEEEEEEAPSTSTGVKPTEKLPNRNNHTSDGRGDIEDLDLESEEGAVGMADGPQDISDVSMASQAQAERREEPIEVETEI